MNGPTSIDPEARTPPVKAKDALRVSLVAFVLVLTLTASPAQSTLQEHCQGALDPSRCDHLGILPLLEDGKIVAQDGGQGDQFGSSLSLDGDTMAVGVPFSDLDGFNEGAVYVYTHDGSDWALQQKITDDDAAVYDNFGASVAIDGDRLAVGATGVDLDGFNEGALYLFERIQGTWTEQARLTAGDASSADNLGAAVALQGDRVAVGAPFTDGPGINTGAVYIFESSGGSWTQQARLTASDAVDYHRFGESIALDGDTLLTGAKYAKVGANNWQGAAYIHRTTGSTWTEEARLVAGDGAVYDHFGASVDLQGDLAAIGSAKADSPATADTGGVYLFTRGTTGWSLDTKISPEDGEWGDGFGSAVALSGGSLGIGAPHADTEDHPYSGAVYVYQDILGTWEPLVRIDGGHGNDWFGSAVAADGTHLAAGSPRHTVDGAFMHGAAYAYTNPLGPV